MLDRISNSFFGFNATGALNLVLRSIDGSFSLNKNGEALVLKHHEQTIASIERDSCAQVHLEVIDPSYNNLACALLAALNLCGHSFCKLKVLHLQQSGPYRAK